ncbi:hypothetical protein FHR70_003866 [Microvirga lupini]|uniref:Uncharacterized protein n=1 Tax=Microvirga lupini TaxID=420324 RepID=A0A7W4VP68_9HYPH|nr:hypothetical protein [Microvirga lupini]MBB3020778.1 hypothetical protein [Microvirga lupini]
MTEALENSRNLRVSLRECRMVLERLMHVANLDPGQVASTRESALYSAAMGLGGFANLRYNVEQLKAAKAWAVTLETDEQSMKLDCAGQHAWIVAPLLADLLVDAYRRRKIGRIEVVDLTARDEIPVVEAFLQRQGFTGVITLGPGPDELLISIQPLSSEKDRNVVDEIRRNGLLVQDALWWELFQLSNEALAPDSFESRRHAGAIIVEADGRVIGRQDEDDTDLSLLAERMRGSVQDATPSQRTE